MFYEEIYEEIFMHRKKETGVTLADLIVEYLYELIKILSLSAMFNWHNKRTKEHHKIN